MKVAIFNQDFTCNFILIIIKVRLQLSSFLRFSKYYFVLVILPVYYEMMIFTTNKTLHARRIFTNFTLWSGAHESKPISRHLIRIFHSFHSVKIISQNENKSHPNKPWDYFKMWKLPADLVEGVNCRSWVSGTGITDLNSGAVGLNGIPDPTVESIAFTWVCRAPQRTT